jgi:hypothetical protein
MGLTNVGIGMPGEGEPPLRSRFVQLAGQSWVAYRPLRWLIPLALLHGLIFLALVPPWQHYDEPTHFEYAWLIANHNHIPPSSEVDQTVRREVADSMYRFRFFAPGWRPNLLAPDGPILGADQRVHPSLYYALVSLPLRLSSDLAVEQQLYLARTIGLGLYVLAVLAAWRMATVVVSDEPLMQLAIPLLLLLTPTFADLMTAVNNDALVNFAATSLFLGCTLLIRDGPRPAGLALASLALGVALGSKRTAVILIVPYLLALLWSWWRAPLRLRVIAAIMLVAGLTLALASLELSRSDSGAPLLVVRPWLAQIDKSYLRMNLDAWVRSATDTSQGSGVYQSLLEIGFTSFWARFAWSNVSIGVWADWAMAATCALCGVGLLIQAWRGRGQLSVWQDRCIWLFLIAVVLGVLSMIARLHPLPLSGRTPYIPRGRYIFSVMLPVIWLLALGWQGLLPDRWKPAGPLFLLGIWLGLDLLAWGVSLTGYFYHITV